MVQTRVVTDSVVQRSSQLFFDASFDVLMLGANRLRFLLAFLEELFIDDLLGLRELNNGQLRLEHLIDVADSKVHIDLATVQHSVRLVILVSFVEQNVAPSMFHHAEVTLAYMSVYRQVDFFEVVEDKGCL